MCGILYTLSGHPTSLAVYAEELASTGQTCFTHTKATESLGVSHGAFLDAAAHLAKRGHIFAPRRGFYVITPTRFLSLGWGKATMPDAIAGSGSIWHYTLSNALLRRGVLG